MAGASGIEEGEDQEEDEDDGREYARRERDAAAGVASDLADMGLLNKTK